MASPQGGKIGTDGRVRKGARTGRAHPTVRGFEPLPTVVQSRVRQVISNLCLTPRQAGVVEGVVCGFGQRRIAREMKIAEATVRTHLRAAFMRLKVHSQVELIAEVLRRMVEL